MRRMRDWWLARAPRERGVLAAGVALVVAALLFAAWLEAERTRSRLASELPQLRAAIAGLERDAAEVRRLRALPAAASADAAPLSALAGDAAVPGAEVAVLDARRVKLTGPDVAFAALLEWLTRARAAHGLSVETARIEALQAPGRVRAELTLARP